MATRVVVTVATATGSGPLTVQSVYDKSFDEVGDKTVDAVTNKVKKDLALVFAGTPKKKKATHAVLSEVIVSLEAAGGSGKGKKKKDPNAPKKPMTAFIIYCNDHRDALKKQSPDLTFGELAKEHGKRWKELSPAKKAEFEKRAKADKDRYEKDMAAYNKKSAAAAAPAAPKEKKVVAKKAVAKK